jgi:DNA-binding LytR/AlgR family response regulator
MDILLVDDDWISREALAVCVLDAMPTARIVPAASAVDAEALLRSQRFDLVVADVVLETRRGGWAVASVARDCAVPVLLVSATEDAALQGDKSDTPLITKREAVGTGFADVLNVVLVSQRRVG